MNNSFFLWLRNKIEEEKEKSKNRLIKEDYERWKNNKSEIYNYVLFSARREELGRHFPTLKINPSEEFLPEEIVITDSRYPEIKIISARSNSGVNMLGMRYPMYIILVKVKGVYIKDNRTIINAIELLLPKSFYELITSAREKVEEEENKRINESISVVNSYKKKIEIN